MKKLLALILVLVMGFMFVACSEPAAPAEAAAAESTPAEDATAEETTGEPIVVATVVKAIGSNWFDSMDWEGTTWAEENNATHNYIGPTAMDAAAQLQSIEDAISLQPDILTVVPIAADASDALLGQARDQGIIVVSHEGAGLTNIDYNVDAFSNQAFGENFAMKTAEIMGEDSNYALMVGTLTTPAHMAWAEAYYAYANENFPDMTNLNDKAGENVIPLEGGANSDTSYSVAKQFLQANPETQAIFVASSSCVNGVARAIEELGMNETCKVMAVGTASGQREYYESGTIPYGAFWYPGAAQYAAYEAGKRLLNGETVETGDDLGVEGYESVTVDGVNIYGSAWLDVTLDNLEEMAAIL